MAQFDIEDDPIRDLRILTVRGRISAAELLEQGRQNLQSEHPPRFILWDMTEVEGFDFETAQLREFARVMKPLAKARAGGRTAMVMPGDLEYGLGRMLKTFAELEEFPVGGNIFRHRAEAERWLFSSIDAEDQ